MYEEERPRPENAGNNEIRPALARESPPRAGARRMAAVHKSAILAQRDGPNGGKEHLVTGEAPTGGETPKDEGPLRSGAVFGRYSIARRIGHGGMGSVYEATHVDLKKRVAVKVLRSDLLFDPKIVQRFVREAETAAGLRHPHIVDITDVGVCDGIPYLVMELLEGEDLSQLLRREGRIPAARVVDLMIPVLAAVSTAHEEGIVHRDLKPENIFVVRGKRGGITPMLLDFGISKVHSGDGPALTDTSSMVGTPCYMSPEQAADTKSVDARSDQFTLGVILYHCLTGVRPFDGPTVFQIITALINGKARPPRELVADIPAEVERIVLRAMSHDPAARYASVRDLAAALCPFGSERAQRMWSDLFGDGSGPGMALEATTSLPPVADPLGATIDATSQPSRSGSGTPSTTTPLTNPRAMAPATTTSGTGSHAFATKPSRRRATVPLLAAGGLVVLIALSIVWWQSRPVPATITTTASTVATSTPTSAPSAEPSLIETAPLPVVPSAVPAATSSSSPALVTKPTFKPPGLKPTTTTTKASVTAVASASPPPAASSNKITSTNGAPILAH